TQSQHAFLGVGPTSRFGRGAVKGVGSSAIDSILEARRRVGKFASLLQFCESVDLRACNKKVIEALVKSGSFDFLGMTRRELCESLEATADSAQRIKDEKERGQSSLFASVGAPAPGRPAAESGRRYTASEWPEEEKLRHEKETLGFYITGHPLNKFADELHLFAN